MGPAPIVDVGSFHGRDIIVQFGMAAPPISLEVPLRQPTTERLREIKRQGPVSETAMASQVSSLAQLWDSIADLLKENRRVFSAFGPSALRQGTDPNLWRKQKADVIAPNNRAILEILRRHKEAFPYSARSIVDSAMNHFEAFEASQTKRISYRNFVYPQMLSTLVALARVGSYQKPFDRTGIRGWLRWKVAGARLTIRKSFVFGSILYRPDSANDIDVAVLHSNSDQDKSAGDWIKSTDSESRILFDLPMHVTLFENLKEDSDYDNFWNKCVQLASSEEAAPLPILPEECDL